MADKSFSGDQVHDS